MALNTISYLTSWLNVPSFCGSLPDCLLILRLPPSTGAGSSKTNNLNCSKITVCSGSVGVGWKRKTRCSKLRSRWDARKWRRKVSWEETDVIRIGGSWESRAEGPEECWWGQVIQRQVEISLSAFFPYISEALSVSDYHQAASPFFPPHPPSLSCSR